MGKTGKRTKNKRDKMGKNKTGKNKTGKRTKNKMDKMGKMDKTGKRTKNNRLYEETDDYWSIESVKSQPHILYLFSDNDKDKNTSIPGGSQAVIRGEKNAYGIRTGYSGGFQGGYRDDMLSLNKKMINSDLSSLKKISKKYKKVKYSSQGFGTGIFNLPDIAPLTYKYLYDKLWGIGIQPSKAVKP